MGRRLLAAFAALLLVATPSRTAPPSEYHLKAVFLFNFAQFVDWPASAFVDSSTPVSIGVLGEDPFGAVLEETIKGEVIAGRVIVIRRSRNVGDLLGCHLLFIARSEQSQLEEVLKRLGSAPVLTVSDIDGFVRRGGVIGFYLAQNRVRFEISTQQAERRGLKLSSQLISLGKPRHAKGRGA